MDYGYYEWFKKWSKLINDNEQKCIICGENKDLTSRIENRIIYPDCMNINLYKDSRNLKANMCFDCYNELEKKFMINFN